jgi:hypothetical protein
MKLEVSFNVILYHYKEVQTAIQILTDAVQYMVVPNYISALVPFLLHYPFEGDCGHSFGHSSVIREFPLYSCL